VSLFRELEDFEDLIDAAAERVAVDPVILEKDYWVSQILRVLTTQFPDDFIFKGGTSLSKCYGLIKRFSEDVDILILPNGRGSSRLTNLMRAMAVACARELGSDYQTLHATDGQNRDVRIPYHAGRDRASRYERAVRLEMGKRGGENPHEMMDAGCLLSEILSASGFDISLYADIEPVLVPVLHPARTLMEKLAILHGRSLRHTSDTKHLRHYYDVYHLLGEDSVRERLADRDEFGRVLALIIHAAGDRRSGAGVAVG